MNIDLRKLYSTSQIELDEEIIIPEEYYSKLDIINISSISIKGKIFINIENEIELNCELKGTFIIPCAISLEEVSYPFVCNVEEIINEKGRNNEFSLALLDILWENIVLEVPIKVVKKGIKTENLKGEGWELES